MSRNNSFLTSSRLLYKHFELKYKILKVLKQNVWLPSQMTRKLSWQFSTITQHISLTYVKNHCIVSGRAKAVFSFFNMSRIMVVSFAKLNYIPFFTKSSW